VVFMESYGKVLRCNTQGRRIEPRDVFDYIRPARVKRVLEDLL